MYISIPFVNLKPLNFYPFYCKYVFFTDNVNLVFSHLHPPTRTVALIRHRLPLLPFPSVFHLWSFALMSITDGYVLSYTVYSSYFLFLGMSLSDLKTEYTY